jgi:hypothetical protein
MSKDLKFANDGVEYMKLCADLTVYWRGSMHTHAEGILNFYNGALGVIGDRLRYYATEEMSNAEPLGPGGLDLLPRWLREPDRTKDVIMLTLDGNEVPDMPSDLLLDFWSYELPEEMAAGMIRLVLPASWIERSADPLLALARRLAGPMRFHSGHGGYSIAWDYKGEYAFPARMEMAVVARRYPAIDLPESATTLMAIPTGLKRVNWLTLVGEPLLETLDDREAVAAELEGEDEVAVERLEGGILVVAGKSPRVGDVNRQEDLRPYHAVGSALADLRSKEHPPFILDVRTRMADEEVTEEWLAYFDE